MRKRLGLYWRSIFIGAVALGVGLLIWLAPVPPTLAAAPAERLFRIQASRFAYSPAVLRVNPGDQVTLELAANDVAHGLEIDGYGLETVAEPGQTARLTFVADRAGTFRFRCTVTCGNMHPFMVGKIQVGNNELLWRASGLAVLALAAGAWRRRK